MNIERCYNLCDTADGASAATPEGIELAREALTRLGRPAVVDYVDIVDAFTLKDENGEPAHTLGLHTFLAVGTDPSCLCVLRAILQQLGYVAGESGEYVRAE
jgi:hypothetical protein